MQQNFIDFALSLYAQPAVQAECLQLQDTQRLSIPLLLCCAWLDVRAMGAGLTSITALEHTVLAWEREVVWPLRQLRRQLKVEADSNAAIAELRLQIKQAELAAEMEVLRRLGGIAWEACTTQALSSVAAYYQIPVDCDSFSALRARMAELQASTLTGQPN